ncbi:MAG: carbohydrate-binding domain-containing protein [Acetobacteraceae bacterium]
MANFTVTASGGFVAPNGTPWTMRGLNAGVQDALQGFGNVLTDYPGLTAIRLNCDSGNDSAASIAQVVQEYTAAGVVVEIEDHSGNGDNVAWYQQMATMFKDNPLVFLETPNEPGGDAATTAQNQIGIINAIRAAGFTNPIGVQPNGGYDYSNVAAVLNTLGTSGLFITPHIYYSGTDPNGAAAYVQSDIQQAKALGLFPSIDEFGNALDGFTADPQGMTVITSVLAANEAGQAGAVFWAMDNGNHPDGTDTAFLNPAGTQLTPVGVDIQPWLSQKTGTLTGGTTPPSLTPSVTPSPDATGVTTVAASPITDQAGNTWTLVQSASNGLQIAVNGTVDPTTKNVVLLEILGGKIVQENATGNWYSKPTPGSAWTQIAAPAAPAPPAVPTAPAAAAAPSPDGTRITTVGGSPIIDAAGNTLTLVQSASNGLQIAVNGTVDATTRNVVLLEVLGGKIIQENTAGNWYSKTSVGSAWSQIAAPVATSVPVAPSVPVALPAPVAPTAPAAPSADGTRITTAGANPIVDQTGHALTLVQSASNGLQIAVNGIVDATTKNVVLLEILGGKIVQENTAGNWYSESAPGGGWTQIAAPAPAPVTPVPPAPITTGSGSDTLVLSMSEDAYKGDAQFTVSVDGKQLGGTFTATAAHASGASQVFTFNGDWATGAHTVTVDFLNDAYGGSPSADRNLYVNAISYDGTATGQTAELLGTGPASFPISDGAAASASSETFVLTSGSAATVTLGIGASRINFIGAGSLTLVGSSGQAVVTVDAGNNKFIAGTGTLDVTGGSGKDAYVFHANSGLLTIEDFSIAKGDTLSIDKALQGSLQQTPDGRGGTMLTFGAGATHGVDIHGMATIPTTSILWA